LKKIGFHIIIYLCIINYGGAVVIEIVT